MRKYVTYEEFNDLVKNVNLLKEEYLVREYIDTSFNHYERFDYLRYLYNIFRLARKKIYLFDNDITLDMIYLLKNISSNIQVTIYMDSSNISREDINKFLKRYTNVNLIFRKNSINEKIIVIDYQEDNERIIHSSTLISNNEKYIILKEYYDKSKYHNLLKNCEKASILLLK